MEAEEGGGELDGRFEVDGEGERERQGGRESGELRFDSEKRLLKSDGTEVLSILSDE